MLHFCAVPTTLNDAILFNELVSILENFHNDYRFGTSYVKILNLKNNTVVYNLSTDTKKRKINFDLSTLEIYPIYA
jgi:hypothetical protein